MSAGFLEARGLRVEAGGRQVLGPVDLALPRGAVTAIIGPNGCGKSTLLRALAGLSRPAAGETRIDGAPARTLPARERARQVALLPQAPGAPEGLSVRGLVARGRTPHLRAFRPMAPADHAAVDRALEATGMTALAERRLDALSGGQRQRAWIAMAVAQEARALLLDEPVAWLDLPHQLEVLRLARRLNRDEGREVVMVLHDLGLAARFADHVVAMRGGRVIAEGPAGRIVGPGLIRALYDIEARMIEDPATGLPVLIAE